MAIENPLNTVHMPTFGLSVGVSAVILLVVAFVLWHMLRSPK